MIGNTDYVSSWKFKGLSAETIKPPTTHSWNPPLLKRGGGGGGGWGGGGGGGGGGWGGGRG